MRYFSSIVLLLCLLCHYRQSIAQTLSLPNDLVADNIELLLTDGKYNNLEDHCDQIILIVWKNGNIVFRDPQKREIVKHLDDVQKDFDLYERNVHSPGYETIETRVGKDYYLARLDSRITASFCRKIVQCLDFDIEKLPSFYIRNYARNDFLVHYIRDYSLYNLYIKTNYDSIVFELPRNLNYDLRVENEKPVLNAKYTQSGKTLTWSQFARNWEVARNEINAFCRDINVDDCVSVNIRLKYIDKEPVSLSMKNRATVNINHLRSGYYIEVCKNAWFFRNEIEQMLIGSCFSPTYMAEEYKDFIESNRDEINVIQSQKESATSRDATIFFSNRFNISILCVCIVLVIFIIARIVCCDVAQSPQKETE